MKFELYKDKAGEWRWRLKAKNGRIIGDCAEGYKRKTTMMKTIDSIRLNMGPKIPLVWIM